MGLMSMNFSTPELTASGGDDSQLKRAVSSVGRSAEYSIAIALFAVCLVAGGTLWFLGMRDPGTVTMPLPTAAPQAASTSQDEKATLAELQRSLGEKFDQIDQKRRAEEQQVQAAQARADAEHARERAALEAEREAKLAAAKKAAAAAAAVATRAPVVATAANPPPAATALAPKTEMAAATPKAARTDATIDWSSCKRPAYPAESVKRMEEGVVIVKADVDAAGKVLDTQIAQSSGFTRLDGTTMRAVAKCSFTAATVDGVAQPAATTVRVAWSLATR
jgi:TonB family protein